MRDITKQMLLLAVASAGYSMFEEDEFRHGRILVLFDSEDVCESSRYGSADLLLLEIPEPKTVLFEQERPVWPESVLRDRYQYRRQHHNVPCSVRRRGCRHR